MCKVSRINLKTNCPYEKRNNLIDYCLKSDKQYVAIGWSYIYENDSSTNSITCYSDYYTAVCDTLNRVNHALNVFWNAEEDDLFWTRDLDGNYWICRAKGKAESLYVKDLDIGAIVPVEAYRVGLEVPGQVKASFNRANGGTSEDFHNEQIIEYSKFTFNKYSKRNHYSYKPLEGDIIDNLPDFDLEELVISYLQIEKNYYVLSNSIAQKSTTIKIECEMIGRSLDEKKKAVVQVKGKKGAIDASSYKSFLEDGYTVYFFAPQIFNMTDDYIEIKRDSLIAFYNKYKKILPESITKWEKMFK